MSHGFEARDFLCSCDRPGRFLCDYPMGEGTTCDRMVCTEHRFALPFGQDLCIAHAAIVVATDSVGVPVGAATDDTNGSIT